MKHLDELTGLRCLAVAMVVLGHSSSFLPPSMSGVLSPIILLGNGKFGVHIFFVLSGFLITSLLLREYRSTGSVNFRAFYWRRLLRISPAFYGFLIVLGVLAAAGEIDVSGKQFVVAGLYLWNYAQLLGINHSFAAHPSGDWYLGHLWSLALEEQFYWLWPATFFVLIRSGIRWFLPVAILMVPMIDFTSYFLFPHLRPQMDIMFHTGCDYILTGCFVAMHRDRLTAWLDRAVTSPRFFSLFVPFAFVVVPNVARLLGGLWIATYGRTLEAATIGLLFLCILAQPAHWFNKMLRLRPIVYLGTISYSIYLWQQFFCATNSPAFLGFPLNIVEAVAAATVSFHCLERPFLKLKDRGRRAANEASMRAAKRSEGPDAVQVHG